MKGNINIVMRIDVSLIMLAKIFIHSHKRNVFFNVKSKFK